MNYEPFLERDQAAIRRTISDFRTDHTSDELFREIALFAVLAYAPSQHAKHAVIACLSAYELRDHLTTALDAGYIAKEEWTEIDTLAQRVTQVLNGYIRATQKRQSSADIH